MDVNCASDIYLKEQNQCEINDHDICDYTLEGNGKRKFCSVEENESDSEFDEEYEGNCSDTIITNVKRKHVHINDEKQSNEIIQGICKAYQESSSSSPCSSGAQTIDDSLQRRGGAYGIFSSAVNIEKTEVCNENISCSEINDNSEMSAGHIKSLSNCQCTFGIEENGNCLSFGYSKQVRFSHDVLVIPGIVSSSYTDKPVTLPTVKQQCERECDKSENDECGQNDEDDGGPCSDWDEELEENPTQSTSQFCTCLHSDCRSALKRVQVRVYREETETAIVNRNIIAIPRLCPTMNGSQIAECAICFVKFTDQKVASPEMCTHNFCLDCLQQWSENMNTCPLDRQRFNVIFVRDRLNGNIIGKIPVKNCELEDDDMDNEVNYCEVCYRRSVDDLVSCNRCGRMYHLTCLSPRLGSVTLESWVCPVCNEC